MEPCGELSLKELIRSTLGPTPEEVMIDKRERIDERTTNVDRPETSTPARGEPLSFEEPIGESELLSEGEAETCGAGLAERIC